jgi:hypothetical protein
MPETGWKSEPGTVLPWVDSRSPEPQVSHGCLARDPDGETCLHGPGHIRQHVRSGLLKWLASGAERAIIRPYPADDFARLYPIEGELFARYGFVPIASHSLTLHEKGGVSWGWAMVVGALLAPSQTVEIRLRIVCFEKASA